MFPCRSRCGWPNKLFQFVWPTTKPMALCLSCSRFSSRSAQRTWMHLLKFELNLIDPWFRWGLQRNLLVFCHLKMMAVAPSHPFEGSLRLLYASWVYWCRPNGLKVNAGRKGEMWLIWMNCGIAVLRSGKDLYTAKGMVMRYEFFLSRKSSFKCISFFLFLSRV